MSDANSTINLSLVSHTNVGKTTLARTLLKKDIGEIGDRPHVTALAEPHLLIRDEQSNQLILWDTPGFGDSIRLAKRLKQRANPIGWFLSEVWDRWMAKPLWSSQQAMKNVREYADVVLYLVNASESPTAVAYVDAEMQIMTWLEKPVIVLLNQMGEPRPTEIEQKELAAWGAYMARFPFVKEVVPMDAFARCWIQELSLFEGIGRVLPSNKTEVFKGLQDAWVKERVESYRLSIHAIGVVLANLISDSERFESDGFVGTIKKIGRKLGWGDEQDVPRELIAMESLAKRATVLMKSMTNQLIEFNGLKGEAVQDILKRVQQDITVDEEVSEGAAAVVGAVLSGALTGLAADLMTGGLSLGAGVIAGAALGGLGFAGVAKGYNQLSGKDGTIVRWNDDSIAQFFNDSILLYMAVAHFGRGRGEWSQSEYPKHWRSQLVRVLGSDAANLPKVSNAEPIIDQQQLQAQFRQCASWATEQLLRSLYPDSKSFEKLAAYQT